MELISPYKNRYYTFFVLTIIMSKQYSTNLQNKYLLTAFFNANYNLILTVQHTRKYDVIF